MTSPIVMRALGVASVLGLCFTGLSFTGCKQESLERSGTSGRSQNNRTDNGDAEGEKEAKENPEKDVPESGDAKKDNEDFIPKDLDKEDIKQDKVSSDFFQLLEDEGKPGPGKFSKDFRSSDEFFTRMGSLVKGKSPHGWVRIWYSSNIKNIIGRPTFKVPPGTVAIKKYQTAEKAGYAVMIKQDQGFDEKNGDWYYEMRDETGALLKEPVPGRIKECTSCHAAAADKDYLAGTTFGITPEDIADNTNTPTTTTGTKGPGAFKVNFSQAGSDFFTEFKDPVDGKSPHGKVRIWYSNNVKALIESAKFTVPEGTVAIKEFDNNGSPGVDGVAVMVKKAKGYDPANNDWYYEMRDQWGAVMKTPAAGKPAMCISCHAAANATDFLAGTKLARENKPSNPAPGKFQFDYYESKNFFTNMNALKKASGAHGDVQIFYSQSMKDKLALASFQAEEGSVAIARYSNAGKLGLVVMTKMPEGYDNGNKNWRYEVRDRYGNLLWDPRPGPLDNCIACHRKSSKTDYLGGTKLQN